MAQPTPGIDKADPPPPPAVASFRGSCWRSVLEVVLILAVFVIQGGVLTPGVNEPNYLAKATHYWNPDWCPHDFFLESADAHLVFYWTFGWLSNWLDLPALAVVGRLLTWLLIAIGWQRLSSGLIPRPLYSVLTAALFVLLNVRFHMAGEWVIGGVEGKGFAYGLVLLGLAALVRGRWRACWLWFGAASSLHVLVGGWSVIAAGFCWLVAGRKQARFLDVFPFMFLGLLLAAPGLWAALTTTTLAEPEVVDRAARIQVFHRLNHHLNPGKFWFAGRFTTPVGGEFGLRFAGMSLFFGALAWRLRRMGRARRLSLFVVGSLLISLAGFAVAILFRENESAAAGILRYYLFRLSDVMVPLGTALLLCKALAVEQRRHRRTAQAVLALLVLLAGWHLGEALYLRHGTIISAADSKLAKTNDQYLDWVDVCRAAADNTHPDSVFLTPMHNSTFKWYAGRSEVVNWKEMPQDAPSTDEWWTRVRAIHRDGNRWRRSLTELTPQQVRAMGGRYQAHYLLTEAEPRLALPLIYRNDSYAIYQLAPAEPPGMAADAN
ncbi:MAG: DUF6798 domain-containing protein [Pirellulales bacterium]